MSVRDPKFSTKEHVQALSIRNMQNFQKAMGVLREPRVVQGIKETRKMFGGIKGAASSVIGLASKFDILGSIMKGVQPLLDMISALFTALSAGISTALIPVFQRFAELLPSLIPIFIQIGEFIGRTLEIGLVPLLTLIEMFLPIIEPILPVIFDLLELGLKPIEVIFGLIFDIIEPLLPYFEDLEDVFTQLSPVIEGLTPIITQLIKWSLLPLVGAIYGVGLVIAGLVDAFSFGTAGAVKGWKEFMEPILNSLLIPGYSTGSSSGSGASYTRGAEGKIQRLGMQHGGIAMTPGFYPLVEGGVPEQVKPLPQVENEMTLLASIQGELMQLNSYNRQLLEEKKWNNVFKRIEQ